MVCVPGVPAVQTALSRWAPSGLNDGISAVHHRCFAAPPSSISGTRFHVLFCPTTPRGGSAPDAPMVSVEPSAYSAVVRQNVNSSCVPGLAWTNRSKNVGFMLASLGNARPRTGARMRKAFARQMEVG